jgi:hypothetical protein
MGPNFREILPILVRNAVRFIVIGGGAALAHGAARLTYDVDVVYARDPENLGRLVTASSPISPTSGVPRPACRFAGTTAR